MRTIKKYARLWFGLAGLLCLAPFAEAQEIDIRLSIKYILSAGGSRPPGHYSTEQNVRDVIEDTNARLRSYGRGYRYVIVPNGAGNFDEVSESTAPGSSDFFTISPSSENYDLENAAEANPAGYFWRTDAVNVYIVSCCAAGATIPTSPSDKNYRVVFFSADVNFTATDPDRHSQRVIWPHELGHYFDLYHPWDNDGISDTRPEPTPFQCSGSPGCGPGFGCALGGVSECCCATKISNLVTASNNGGWTQLEFLDLRYNIMGYMAAADCVCQGEDMVTTDNMRLSEGQLDRFTDATRQYRSSDVSGLTFFVDRQNTTEPFNGLSTDPYTTLGAALPVAGPRDIIMIRGGVYPENIVISTPRTLRASRGVVRIGN